MACQSRLECERKGKVCILVAWRLRGFLSVKVSVLQNETGIRMHGSVAWSGGLVAHQQMASLRATRTNIIIPGKRARYSVVMPERLYSYNQ